MYGIFNNVFPGANPLYTRQYICVRYTKLFNWLSLGSILYITILVLVFLDVGHKNWTEAKRICQEINGQLPEVKTQDEFFEAAMITSEVSTSFWLGGSYGQVEGDDWRWESQGRSVTKIWGRDEGKNINFWLQNAKQHGTFTKGHPV